MRVKSILLATGLVALVSAQTASAVTYTGQVLSQNSTLTIFGPSSGPGIWGTPGTPAAAIQNLHYILSYNNNGSNSAGNQFTLDLSTGAYALTGSGAAGSMTLQEANVQGIAPHLLAIANSAWTTNINGTLTPTNQINLDNVLDPNANPTPGGIVDRNFFDNGGGQFAIIPSAQNANGTALVVAGSPAGSINFNHLAAEQGFGTNNFMFIQYLGQSVIDNIIYRDFAFSSWAQSLVNGGLIAQYDAHAVIRFNIGTTGNPVPEPMTMSLLGGALGVGALRRRFKKS